MKIAFVCGLIVALTQCISAAQICGYDVDYDSAFIPDCTGNDILIKWPNYADFTKYFACEGHNNYVLKKCPEGKYFSYILQQCTDCPKFIPAPKCQHLKTNGQPNCVPLKTPTTLPPPTTVTTAKPTTTVTTPLPTRTTTASKPTTPSVPTPPTGGPIIPTPPVLPTSAPGVPTPPVEPPTPPTIDVTPPSAD